MTTSYNTGEYDRNDFGAGRNTEVGRSIWYAANNLHPWRKGLHEIRRWTTRGEGHGKVCHVS